MRGAYANSNAAPARKGSETCAPGQSGSDGNGPARADSTETSVLGHLRNGMAPEAVAGELAVQLSTVRSHVRHLMEKTGAKRIGELVALLA